MKTIDRRNLGRRHPAVVEFSREHHHGLVFCIRMKRHLRENRPMEYVKMLFRSYWCELKEHTHREAEWAKTQANKPEIRQMMDEHGQLETQFALIDRMSREELLHLVDELREHIRYEERVLFPLAN